MKKKALAILLCFGIISGNVSAVYADGDYYPTGTEDLVIVPEEDGQEESDPEGSYLGEPYQGESSPEETDQEGFSLEEENELDQESEELLEQFPEQQAAYTAALLYTENGSICFSEEMILPEQEIFSYEDMADLRSFEPGTEISLEVIPDEGFELQDVYVSSGTVQDLLYEVGIYETMCLFYMPEDSVAVSAVFTEIVSDPDMTGSGSEEEGPDELTDDTDPVPAEEDVRGEGSQEEDSQEEESDIPAEDEGEADSEESTGSGVEEETEPGAGDETQTGNEDGTGDASKTGSEGETQGDIEGGTDNSLNEKAKTDAAEDSVQPAKKALKNTPVKAPADTAEGTDANYLVSVSISPGNVTLHENGETADLVVTKMPETSSEQIILSSTDTTVADVTGSVVTAVHAGSCRIEAKNAEGVVLDSTLVTVDSPMELTVNGGSGSGFYRAGEHVTVQADAPEEGKQFAFWSGHKAASANSPMLPLEGTSSVYDSSITIVMPPEELVLTANYEDVGTGTETTEREDVSGNNTESQNYQGNWSSVVDSYLTPNEGGFMRVQNGNNNDLLIEYYNDGYEFLRSRHVRLDLPIFGGFYEAEDCYYVVTGQNNYYESDDLECYRVTKYDKNWNRLSAAGLKDCNTYIPFDAGSCRMAMEGKYLLVHTSHEMYMSDDGLHHQANVTFQLDTETMTLTDSRTGVSNNSTGYVSHSFNQFVRTDGGKLVTVDHGDAYPRAVCLMLYRDNLSGGTFGRPDMITLMSFYGQTGANYTAATVGGLEVSGTSYLVVGNSADQTTGGNRTKNVFLSVTDKGTREVTTTWLTAYAEGETTTNTPMLVPLGDGNYLILWSRAETDGQVVYYQKIDGAGNLIGDVRSMSGNLSDCQPVLKNGKLTWYVYEGMAVRFYSIDAGTLDSSSTDVYTPVLRVTLNKTELDVNAAVESTSLTASVYPAGATVKDVNWSSSDPNVLTVDQSGKLTPVSCGEAVITAVSASNEQAQASCHVTVFKYIYMAGVSISGDTSYTGEPVTPTLTLTEGGTKLTEGRDYTLTWSDNIDVGSARVRIQGTGFYRGAMTMAFDIRPGRISNISLDSGEITYSGEAQNPSCTVTNVLNRILQEGTDYELSWINNINAGTATVYAYGRGNYTGTLSARFTINPASVSDAVVSGIENKTYTGSAMTQSPVVKVGGRTLVQGTEYTLSYDNNINCGTATMYVKGTGNYTDTLNCTFTIAPVSLNGAVVSGVVGKTYTGSAVTQSPVVKVNGRTLMQGTDYTLSYTNNVNCGTAKVRVNGTGNYTGYTESEFTISPASIAGDQISGIVSKTYTGSAVTQSPVVKVSGRTLVSGTDYTLSYENNINCGTATLNIKGTGNYTGTAKTTFTITPVSIKDAEISGIESKTYTGSAVTQNTVIKVGGRTLVQGTDYTLSYENNINCGTATLNVNGTGNYTGTAKTTFTIDPASLIDAEVSGIESKTYTGSAVTQSPVVKIGGRTLDEGKDYSLSYKNNVKVGKAAVTIKGKGNYTGTLPAEEFRILFYDVPETHAFNRSVYWASDNGIGAGYTGSREGWFGVDDSITRGQVVTFLWRAAGKPEPGKNTQTFRDVPTSHAFYKAIQWASEMGITGGYTGSRAGLFGPDDLCTRGQIATFLWRYAGKPAPASNAQTFSDVPVKHSFYKAIQWASENRITAGYSDGSFGVDRTCTRGHCVTFLYRLIGS